MKPTTTIIYPAFAAFALVCFALTPQTRAACHQGCLTNNNTVLGDDALLNNTGADNTAVGSSALLNNTTGAKNTANGAFALFSNTTGVDNTATGQTALFSNTSGNDNTAVGTFALINNADGSGNNAVGSAALSSNTSGAANNAVGGGALLANTTGNGNNAVGNAALQSNVDGVGNDGFGNGALTGNVSGIGNTAIGDFALIGSTGSFNIALGANAGSNLTTGDNNIDIGNSGVAGEADTIRIGMQGTQRRIFIAGISSASGTGRPVVISGNGQLGVAPSSQRFKEEIKPMGAASEVILALKPVTFRYKKEIDPDRTPEFGLVAEEVEKVNPDLVARDEQGKPFTVRYEAVNAMLLNEFLKAHHQIEEQKATIAKLKSGMEALTATVKNQASQIQKVSAQLELQKPSAQTVVNSQ